MKPFNSMKLQSHLVLAFMLFLNGCSIQTMLFDIEPGRSIVVVETAKMKLSYSGDNDHTKEFITMLQKAPLNDFNATKENYVRINSINSKIDSVDMKLEEFSGIVANQNIEEE